MRTILRDLYDWNEPITGKNWQRLDGLIRERADDRAWSRKIIRRAGVQKLTTELSRRGDGGDDDLFHYSMEWAFFTRTQRGEYDTALYELERCWGKKPGTPIPHSAGHRAASERTIRTLEDVRAAMDHYVKELAASRVLSMATHISTDIAFRRVTDGEMEAALARRGQAGPKEQRRVRLLHSRVVPGTTGVARRPGGLPVQFRRRADAVRDGQPHSRSAPSRTWRTSSRATPR